MTRIALIGALALSLLGTACGGDDGGGGFGVPADVEDTTDQDDDGGGFGQPDDVEDTTDQDDGDGGGSGLQLVCEDPPPTELGVGGSFDGTANSDGGACLWVDVPDGLDSISFETTSVGGDVGLSVAYGFLSRIQFPGLGEFWTDEQGGADELITIPNPPAGPYFVTVGVVGFGNEADFTFSVSAADGTTTEPTGATPPSGRECAAPAVTLEFGGSASGEVTGRDGLPNAADYYCVEIPEGLATASVTVGDLTDSLEVIVLRPDGRVWRDSGGPDDDAVAVIEGPEPGAYIVDVVIGSGRTSSYTISADVG